MRDFKPAGNMLWAVLFCFAATVGFNGCSDVSNVSAPPAPAAPGPLTILTSDPLPAGTVGIDYNVTLAPIGGAPPYTWSLALGSPTLPNGLTLTPSNGKILGVPTAVTATKLTEFKLQDSKGQSVQKVLAITVNAAPIPLAILTPSLQAGTINQHYATALGGTGGTTPYTWGLKSGSTPLPDGISLDPTTGAITGTPTVTSSATHVFTLQDITSFTVEKTLTLTISAVPLSITTTSLPQGTASQNYSEQLAASGGTGAYTWDLAGSSPALPTGLTLNPSTGLISGIPTGTSNKNYTFTVTDQTPPTPQTATKTLQLIVGAAPPELLITTPAGTSLPSGSVGSAYSTSLAATGGTGAHTWSVTSGTLPNSLSLTPSTGAITGTPQVGSNGTISIAVRVHDSGTPQQAKVKSLSITITLPTAPNIATTPLPAGIFNLPYNHTVSVTGGFGTLVWGVTSGALPPGLSLNSSNGNISGTPTSTGSFNFDLRVTDQIPQSDVQNVTITINPPVPPTITSPNSSSLPTGTVNQPYLNTQLVATGGATPYTWSVDVLPGGLSLDPNTGVISSPGGPSPGTNGNYNPTFTVMDSTFPTKLTGTRSYSLTINANVIPVSITTSSLPPGSVCLAYSQSLTAQNGTTPYIWSLNSGSVALPDGLSPSASGTITGKPTTAGTTPSGGPTFKVEDSTSPNKGSATKQLSITISPAATLQITTTTLPDGTTSVDYSQQVMATGGCSPLTWTIQAGLLPLPLTIDATTGIISGTQPITAGIMIPFTVRVTDDLGTVVDQPLLITIN
jgi:Putative Ig domain